MKNIRKIFKYIHIPKDKLALYLLFTLLSILFSLLSLGIFMPFLDLVFNTHHSTENIESASLVGKIKTYFLSTIETRGKIFALGIICITILLATFLKNLFLYLSYYISTPVRNRILSNFRTNLYDKILKLPLSYYTDQKKGDILSRMSADINEIQGSIVTVLEGLIKDPLTVIGFLITMIYISPKLSLFLIISLPLTAVIIGRVSKKLKKQSSEWGEANGENLSHVEETLGGLKIIKAFVAEKKMQDKFAKSNNRIYNVLNKMNLRRDLASPLTEVLGVFVLIIILYAGGLLALTEKPELSGSELLFFIFSFAMMINPAKSLSASLSNIQRGLGAIERIEQILDAPILIEEIENPVQLKGFSHSIEFKNVHFSYDDKTVLNNINFTIEKGKMIALVGSSGAGKSTLADLVPRFHDVVKGEILIDGINIKNYGISSLRKQMSVVTQEPVLFNDTIAGNIALGNTHATIEEITYAAKIANAHNFIIHKENGYNTNIGDRGMKLSGGERQRITIARAVLQNPPILILDEATSSLDTESERLVQDAINNLMKERTSIVIAHRLSTIRNADEIIVLQKGEILERGTHDSLIQQNGFYNKLVEMQEIK